MIGLALVHQDLVPLLLALLLDPHLLALVLSLSLALVLVLLAQSLAFVPVRTGTGWRV